MKVSDLTAGDQNLGSVKTKRGLFLEHSLSYLLFVLIMIPLTMLLRKTKISYQLNRKEERTNQLFFMDDYKIFVKSSDYLDCLVKSV